MTIRSVSVLAMVAVGAIGMISSTQTWLVLTLNDADQSIEVAGAAAVTILAPLSVTALALGAALSLAGRALRYAFGIIALGVGAALGYYSLRVATQRPADAVAGALAERTGITGDRGVAELVASIEPTPWPVIVVMLAALMCAAGLATLITARRWASAGRRYRRARADHPGSASLTDAAVDSWDGLSRGTDPTA